jgi:hypothetical protein
VDETTFRLDTDTASVSVVGTADTGHRGYWLMVASRTPLRLIPEWRQR